MTDDRDEAARYQYAWEEMIRMRESSHAERARAARGCSPHPDPLTDREAVAVRATAATALVMATLSAHAPSLPEHVIKAAAIAAGNATVQRNRNG